MANLYIWACSLPDLEKIKPLETRLFHDLSEKSQFVNGAIAPDFTHLDFALLDLNAFQVMDDREIESRQDPALRFPRQIQHFNSLVDYILNTQDKPHLRRALEVYFKRLSKYYSAFVEDGGG